MLEVQGQYTLLLVRGLCRVRQQHPPLSSSSGWPATCRLRPGSIKCAVEHSTAVCSSLTLYQTLQKTLALAPQCVSGWPADWDQALSPYVCPGADAAVVLI